MLKLKHLVLVPFFVFFSCDSSDDGDDGYGSCGAETYFKITGINSFSSSDSPNNLLDPNITFAFDAEYFTEKSAKGVLNSNATSKLSCATLGVLGDIVGVDTLYVKTVFDYNNYIAGDTINSIVTINDGFSQIQTLEDYIQENSDGVLSPGFNLKLSETSILPDVPYALDLTYILNNGEEFNHTTETITISE